MSAPTGVPSAAGAAAAAAATPAGAKSEELAPRSSAGATGVMLRVPPRRVTIKLGGSVARTGQQRVATAGEGAASLARSASASLALRKRGSGSLGNPGAYADEAAASGGPCAAGDGGTPRLKPSKSARLLAPQPGGEEVDSAASAPRSSARRAYSGPGHAGLAMQHSRPSFADLVAAGVFPPGAYDFAVGTAPPVTAVVTPGGGIEYGGDAFGSISAFALAAARERNPTRQACDGWKEVRLGGRRLEAWRDAYLAGAPPPEVPPPRAAAAAPAAGGLPSSLA
jgi:hypothetical protein